MSWDGPVWPAVSLYVLRGGYISRGGPMCPEGGLYVPRRTQMPRGGPICPEVGLSPLISLEAGPSRRRWFRLNMRESTRLKLTLLPELNL